MIKIKRLPNSEISILRKKMLEQSSEISSSNRSENKILAQTNTDS